MDDSNAKAKALLQRTDGPGALTGTAAGLFGEYNLLPGGIQGSFNKEISPTRLPIFPELSFRPLGYLLAFISTLCFSISNCLWAKPLGRLPFLVIICLRSAISGSLFWILFLSDPDVTQQLHINFPNITEAVLISVVSSAGLLLYTFSLRFTKVSVAVPTTSINSFFGVLTALIVLHEAFHWKIVPVFFILCLGLLFTDSRAKPEERFVFSSGVWLNIGAAVVWGVTFALFYIPVSRIGAIRFSAILETSVFGVALIASVLRKDWDQVRGGDIRSQLVWILPLGLLGVGGVLLFNESLRFVPVQSVSLIGSAGPAISAVIAVVWLKERLQRRQWTGIALICAGVALLFAGW